MTVLLPFSLSPGLRVTSTLLCVSAAVSSYDPIGLGML